MDIAPVILIQDAKGNALNDVITYFKYKFSEEDDDVCEIKIQSSNVKLADKPEYQEGQTLKVSWGYLNGSMSAVRLIIIFDTVCSYEDDIILTLTCHERFVLSKMDVVKSKNKKQLKNGVPITLSPRVLENMNVELEKGNTELAKILESNNIDVSNKQIKQKEFDSENTIVSLYNGNTSTFQNLRQFLNKLPGGPYVIESRDDKVVIKTRDLKQNSHKTWVYRNEGGDLISFTPETKNRGKASSSSDVDVTNWNPSKKEAYVQNSSKEKDEGIKLADGSSIKTWDPLWNKTSVFQNAPTRGIAQKPSAGYDGRSKLEKLGGKKNNKVYKKIYKYTDHHKNPNYIGNQNPLGFLANAAARGSTAVSETVYEFAEDVQKPTDHIISPEHDPRKAKAHADNRRKENEMKNNPASAKAIGEPSVMSGQVCTILGVANKHSGNYYILSCEHTIDDSGYMLNLDELSRDGVNTKSKSIKPQKAMGRTSEGNTTEKTWGEIISPYDYKQIESPTPLINQTVGPHNPKKANTKIPLKKAE